VTTISPVSTPPAAESSAAVAPGPGPRACESCGRQWSGFVNYCPYCGRMPGLVERERDDRPQAGSAPLASGHPAAAVPPAGWSTPPDMKTAPLRAVSSAGETSEPDTATSSPVRRRSLELLATVVVAVVTALLLWVVMGPSVPETGKAASPQVAGRVTYTPAPAQPATDPAQLPPIPRPADPAVAAPAVVLPAPAAPAVAAPAAAAPAEKGALCSAAHEAAGLCKSR